MERKEIRYVEINNEYKHLYSFIESFPKGKVCSFFLSGPPGTAKTTLAMQLAKDFGSEMEIIDGAEELDRRDLEGSWQIRKDEGTVFVPGPLVKVFEKANANGICFLIANEVNAIRTSEQVSFNSMLSEAHINLISNAGEQYSLNKDAKLVVIGTMNYKVCGINELQEAFDDRFYLNKEMKYAPPKREAEIIVAVSGCKKELAALIVDVAQEFRQAATKEMSIPKIFSTRLAVNFAQTITRMGLNYVEENIEDMIVNKLCKEPSEIETGRRLLQGKDFENRIRNIYTEKAEVIVIEDLEEDFEVDNYEEDFEEDLELLDSEYDAEKKAIDIMKEVLESGVKASIVSKNELWEMTRKQLCQFCRDNGISGFSKKTKPILIELISKHLEKENDIKKQLNEIGEVF